MKNIKDYVSESVFKQGDSMNITKYAEIVTYVTNYHKNWIPSVNGSTLTIQHDGMFKSTDSEFFNYLNKLGITLFVFDVSSARNGQGSTHITCSVPSGIRIETNGNIYASNELFQSDCAVICNTINVEELAGVMRADIECEKMFIHKIKNTVKFNNLKCPEIDVRFNDNNDNFSLADLLRFSSNCKLLTIYAKFTRWPGQYIYHLKRTYQNMKEPASYKDGKWYVWRIKPLGRVKQKQKRTNWFSFFNLSQFTHLLPVQISGLV